MRITNRMMTENAIQHMASNKEKINNLSEKIASGKSFLSASEDPVNASLSLNLRSTLRASASYRDVAELTGDWMTATDFAFQQMDDLATRAQNLMLRGLNDTLGEEERDSSLATEMSGIFNEAKDYANYQHSGQYIFGGYRVDIPPFHMVDADTVGYQGDLGKMQRALAPGQTVDMNVVGQDVFTPYLQTLKNAEIALKANDMDALRGALNQLKLDVSTMDQARTSNGARMRQVSSATDYLKRLDIEVKALLSQKEDVNLAEAITELRGQETTYQSVLEVTQRAVSALSLFDYLR